MALRTLTRRDSNTTPLDQFRAQLSDFLGVEHCYLAASGRTALYLLLKALQTLTQYMGRTEVILPAYTCPSLAKVVLDAELAPRLVDIQPTTFQFDPEQLRFAVGEQTLAVILVHPFGLPLPVEPMLQIVHGVGAVLIEDAAQSMGAQVHGKPVGTSGDFGLYSLGPGKPLSTGGGGIVCCQDKEAAATLDRVWSTLPAPSSSASATALLRLSAFSLAFHPAGWWLATRAGAQRRGDNEANWGFALQGLTPSQAIVGSRLLSQLSTINRRRCEHAHQLMDRLQGQTTITLVAGLEDYGHSKAIFLRLPMLAESQQHRDRLVDTLSEAGIGAGKMYKRTMAEFFPAFAAHEYPGAEQIAQHLFTLPTHHYLNDADIRRIVTSIQTFQA